MEPDNTSLEQRLAQHLGATADGIEAPSGSPGTAIGIAHRRRRNRRTFGSSLAAIALVATGIGAYQLSDGDGSVDIAADVDDGEEAMVEETTNDDEATAATGTSDPLSLPASTGPSLDWNEVDASTNGWFGGSVVWTGESFVAVTHNTTGSALLRSEDGTTWTESNTPDGYDIWGLQGSGQSLVAWGADTSQYSEETEPVPFIQPETAVFVSNDNGNSWDVLPPIPTTTDDTVSPYVFSSGNVGGAAIVDSTVVVGVSRFIQLDVEKIIEDFGIETDGEAAEFRGWSTSEDAVGICLDEFCNQEFTITFEELGLTEAESESMWRGSDTTTVYRSVDGGEWVLADLATDTGYTDAILAVGGEFKMCVMGEEDGSSLYSSPDGLSWTLVSSNNQMGGLTTDGTNLYAQRWDMEGGLVRSTDGGVTWSPLTDGVRGAHQVNGGPSGIVAAGQLYDESFDGPGMSMPVSLEKDGYLITWQDIGLTVTEIATGEVVLSFDEEDMDQDEAPETVIEEESDETGSFSLTFLDPETLEPLVTLNEDDLNEAFNIDTSMEEGNYEEPEFFLGWSGDGGETWGWQTSTEAFGVNGWAQFAVGDGIVIAMVEEFIEFAPEAEAPAGDAEVEAGWSDGPNSRIFVASVD